MKVIKDNYNNVKEENTKQMNPYPRTVNCDRCDSELLYEESDVEIGACGCAYVRCPLCNEETFLDDNEKTITLTANNIEFPTHFYHTSKETGAVDICNNEQVKEYIQKAIKYFRENKEEFAWHTSCGNLYVSVNRWDGDEVYEVTVTNNYYETEIPFEDKDY